MWRIFSILIPAHTPCLISGTFASGKELPELKASLDLIRTTADKMITAIEQNLQDIRKERGIDQVNEKTSVLSELPIS